MELQNKKTGDIGVLNVSNNKYYVIAYGLPLCGNSVLGEYDTLDALMQEWKDYKDPKEYWRIDCDGTISHGRDEFDTPFDNACKSIGNYFETEEEAEKAVEKLKAWKRLKDKGFRFNRWTIPEEPKTPHIKLVIEVKMDVPDSPYDLDLLFGGKE